MESELKYIIPGYKLAFVLDFIRALCRPDSRHHANEISSIYFDTGNLASLYEKVHSDFLKTKFRLRWYRELDTRNLSELAFTEAKFRVGSKRVKRRVPSDIRPEELESISLDNRKLLAAPLALRQQNHITRQLLMPSIQINYCRYRFIEPVSGCRISIDENIRGSKVNKQLLPDLHPSKLDNAVLEIKGNLDNLPPSLRRLGRSGLRKASFSKYLCCIAKSQGGVFDPR